MMEQMYLPYSGSSATAQAPPHHRHMGPALGPPQGSKLGTYMSQVQSQHQQQQAVAANATSTTFSSFQQQQAAAAAVAAAAAAAGVAGQANGGPTAGGGAQSQASTGFQLEQEMSGKLAGLGLDHGMKMMNRQSNAGISPVATSPGFGPPRFSQMNPSMSGAGGPMQYGGSSPNFSRQGPIPSFPTSGAGGSGGASRLSPTQLRLNGQATPGSAAGGAASAAGPSLTNPPPMRPSVVTASGGNGGPVPVSSQQQQQPTAEQEAQAAASAAKVTVFSENGTTYFYNPDESLPSQLSTGQVVGNSLLVPNWSAYSGTPSQVVAMKVRNAAPTAMQESESKMEILTKQMICHTIADPEANQDLPSEVDNFTSLCPLEPPASSPLHKSSTFSYVTTVYKSVNIKTGQHMCLRRIHGYRLVNTKCMGLVEQWKKMAHSNLVTLRQVFTSKSFGDHSMIFVYDYYPGAETLMSRHFNSQLNPHIDPFNGESSRPYSQSKNNLLRRQAAMNNSTGGLLAEALIWNYIIQLTSALRYIHGAGLACRTLDPTKIIVVGKYRLLLNCSGIFDVLTYDPSSSNPMTAMAVYQQEDLVSLGRIVLALACNSFLAIQRENVQHSMELVTSNYSSDLRNLIMYLLTNSQRVKSVNDLMPMVGARFYTALDSSMQRTDSLEQELAREVECGRVVRLLTKLCSIVDRAEFNMVSSWAETGDRYMLKLFRDYLFHQVMEDGRPFLDMAHIITNLNRLDAGIPDMIGLMSRDEQNVLVVSYAELKNCLERSYTELLAAASQKPKMVNQ